MNRRVPGAVLSLVLLAPSLAACSDPAARGGEVTGLEFEGRCRTELGGCSGAGSPVLVANPDAAEYLVLWRAEYRPSEAKLYARRVDAKTGERIGESVAVAFLGEGEASVLGAYDKATRRYIVAWKRLQRSESETAPAEILELSATHLDRTAGSALPDTPGFLRSLSLGRRGQGLVVSFQDPPGHSLFGGPRSPKLALTSVGASTGAGPSLTLEPWPRAPGGVAGALAHDSRAGRHMVVTVRREEDAYQTSKGSPFVTRLVTEEGRPLETAGFDGVRRAVPVGVDAAFNPRHSEYLVAWSAWIRDDERQVFAQRLNARGMPVGEPFSVAEVAPGLPDSLSLAVDVALDGYAISWADTTEGWLKLVDPRRPAIHSARMIFDRSQPGSGGTVSSATNARAGTHAQAWTDGGHLPDGRKIYIRVVRLDHQ